MEADGDMRPLPNETIHLPFHAGPYRMAMDLVSVPEADWFELDNRYLAEMAEKRHLLATRRNDVFTALPGSDAARHEALAVIVEALTRLHPDWFERDATTIRNRLTGESWTLHLPSLPYPSWLDLPRPPAPDPCHDPTQRPEGSERPPTRLDNRHRADGRGEAARDAKVGVRIDLESPEIDPLELAGRMVQEDLCLIQGGIFTAASLCFPSRWRLADKIGKPLTSVHGPVPIYPDRLAAPVDRFLRHLKPNHIAARLNWSMLDDPSLFQPNGKWRSDTAPQITADTAGDHLYLRVERQTLRRLPKTQAILFGIRVHVYRLTDVIDHCERASALASAIRALPASILHYKSLNPFHDAVLAWLDSRTA